ncbi:MAG: PAS domain-containing protein [Alphaproteobacteria bacterium]|nr:PAS domain-containing protein [Alphaproteobacteria bacterium]
MPHEAGASASFIARLPPLARDSFESWRQARRRCAPGQRLPELGEFAPHGLPRQVLPWILIHRERADGEFVYGLAGEELVRFFGAYPSGQPILAYADPAERAARLAVIRNAVTSGRAVWFTGSLLFEYKDAIPVGRLGLPALSGPVAARERVLLLVYFILGPAPKDRSRGAGRSVFDPASVVWCDDGEMPAA